MTGEPLLLIDGTGDGAVDGADEMLGAGVGGAELVGLGAAVGAIDGIGDGKSEGSGPGVLGVSGFGTGGAGRGDEVFVGLLVNDAVPIP